ncbi:energy transducer TonB [Woodsholea maritima]|uniref:energy transducer TonB n=1 Tax=Woodsholea maritima TaxID=240237 RepID=UPI0003641ACA|nr:energy transducer TonB [Woodsholea maritima]
MATTLQPMHSQLTRIVMMTPLAAFITLVVFMVMQMLIRVEAALPELAIELPRITIFEYVAPEQPERRAFDPVEPTPAPPARPDVEPVDPLNPTTFGDGYPPVPAPRPDTGGTGAMGPVEIPMAGLVRRINPDYPMDMASRGIEGECLVAYDILGSGHTANVRIINCTHSGFARSTVRAVEQWRYGIDSNIPATAVRERETTNIVYNLD